MKEAPGRRLFWNLLFPAFLILLIFPPRLNGYLNPHDEGIWLGLAQAFLDGRKLYTGVFFYYGPLLPVSLAGALKIITPTLASIRFFFWLLNVVGLLCIYGCLLKWVRSETLRLAYAIFLWMIPAASPFSSIPMAARYGAGFLSLLFWPTSSLLAGIGAGIAYFTTQEVGLAAAIAGFFYALLQPDRRQKAAQFATGLGATFLLGVLCLLLKGRLVPYVQSTVTQVAQIVANEQISYPSLFLPYTRQPSYWLLAWQHMAEALSLYGLAISYVGIFLWTLWRAVRRKSFDRLVFAAALYGSLVSFMAWEHPDRWHIYFALSPAFLVWAVLAEHVSAKGKDRATLAALLAGSLLVLPQYLARQSKNLGQRSLLRATDIQRAGSAKLPAPQADGYEYLVRWIQSHTEPHEPFLFYPYDGTIYFLADRPNPTFFPVLGLAVTPAMQERAVKDLELNHPQWVIWDSEDTAFLGVPIDQFLSLIHQYVFSHYAMQSRVGPFVFMKRRSTIPAS